MSEPSYIMLGLKSFFRRKKKRKAQEEQKIESKNTMEDSVSNLTNDENKVESSELPSEIELNPAVELDTKETVTEVEQAPSLNEREKETEPSIESDSPISAEKPPTTDELAPQMEQPVEINETIEIEGNPPSSSSTQPTVQPPISDTKKTRSIAVKLPHFKSWIIKKKEKSKEKAQQDANKESSLLRYLTFVITAIAMTLGLSILPLFPQPLPILLGILVAFVTFRNPRFGMPIGGGLIGFGLIFHLSKLYFFSFLGETRIRIAVVVIWMTLFILLPIIFNRYKSALAIDLGLIAFTTLFSNSTYFLAIPLILTSAVFFKKHASLSIIYYVLLSVPLQIIQYFKYTVSIIPRTEWWLEPGSSPPVFVSLTSIFTDLTSAMSQFRLYDTSKVIYDITGQMTWEPNFLGRTLSDALKQYLDSVPGILLFIVIVAGLAGVLIFFAKALTSPGGLISLGDKLLLCFTATITCALFFVFLGILQIPLAFTADVTPSTFILAPIATFLLTIPAVFVDFTPKQTATNPEVREKAHQLLERLEFVEKQLNNVKENIPVNVSSPEGKMMVLKDSIQDIIQKCDKHFYDVREINEKFVELDKSSISIDELETNLNRLLLEYQIFINGEFSNWIGKFKEFGLTIDASVTTSITEESNLDERIENIKSVLEQGKSVAKEVTNATQPVYDTIRELYDPSLPIKNKTLLFANERLEKEGTSWIVLEALYSSLFNWNRQYRNEVSSTIKHMQRTSDLLEELKDEKYPLVELFGDDSEKILNYAKEAETIRSSIEQKDDRSLSILNILALKHNAQSLVCISQEVISLLFKKLNSEEKAIERSLNKNYPWNKNVALSIQLKKANEALEDKKKQKLIQLTANLPIFLSYINETFDTLLIYKEEKRFLLTIADIKTSSNTEPQGKKKRNNSNNKMT